MITDLITTNDTIDPTKIAAWFSCIVIIYGLVKASIQKVVNFKNRPKIGQPAFSCHEGIDSKYVQVEIDNIGKTDINIGSVRLLWVDEDGTNIRCELSPTKEGAIPPRRPMTQNDIDPDWRRYYILPRYNPQADIHMLNSFIKADPSTHRLEIWAKDTKHPLWVGYGKKLSKLLTVSKLYAKHKSGFWH